MSTLAIAYIGVGTNLGDRIQNLIDARQHLRLLPQVTKLRCSSFYLSSPVGYLEQPDFVNCVFELAISLDRGTIVSGENILGMEAQSLFSQLQRIETDLGRVRNPENQNAARLIDLDLLSFDQFRCDDPNLILPHPRIRERLFVLLPILELNPEITLQGIGRLETILDEKELSGNFADQQIFRLGADL